jgi:predicted nucleic acid-binding Zn ribbon protein
MKHCQWCDTAFESPIKYQIYCSPECREAATKEKITQRYAIERRNRRMKQSRKCKMCGEKLSAYNDDTLCFSCLINPGEVNKTLKEIKGLADGKDKPNKS